MTAMVGRNQQALLETASEVGSDTRPLAPPRAADDPEQQLGESQTARNVFAAFVTVLLGVGLVLAYRQEFTPEEGVGYWLGITGASMLLFLLAYPMRKRVRFMARAGAAPFWFKLHMVLGILGPVIILYHSNFSLGATNSNVALFAMSAVALSGIVGRYIYGKIHNGLYGARSTVHDLLEQATPLIGQVEKDVGGADGSIAAKLSAYADKVLKERRSLLLNLFTVLSMAISSLYFRSRILAEIRRTIRQNAGENGWSKRESRSQFLAARSHVQNFIAAVTKASELSLYERLFSLWHVFHVPLFFLLIITGITHVISVHLY